MKSRIKPTRREVDILADMVFKETIEGMQIETAVGVIATARFFGLGEIRANRYIDFLEEVKKEYKSYENDGVIREMAERELSELKIDPVRIFEPIDDMKKTQYEIKQLKKHNSVSVKEATELTAKLQQFEAYMKGE